MAHVHLTARIHTALALIMGLACSAEPTPAPNPVPVPVPVRVATAEPHVAPAPEPPALDAFPAPAGEPRYKRVLSKRLRLSIPLPNRSGWEMKREKSSFLILEHEATASRLLVSVWRENDLMNRDTCEERARWLRELPKRAGETLSSRRVDVPAGFDTEVDVGFANQGEGAPIDGWVLAFGGRARECFALIYTTTASGDGAEQVVGDRLAVMQTLTLEGIERRIGNGIGREPLGN